MTFWKQIRLNIFRAIVRNININSDKQKEKNKEKNYFYRFKV